MAAALFLLGFLEVFLIDVVVGPVLEECGDDEEYKYESFDKRAYAGA
jgi:hypothetical protein